MKFITSVLLLLASILCMGLAFAQQTVWRPEPNISVSADVPEGLAIVDGKLLAAHDGTATVRVKTEDGSALEVVQGRTEDANAWAEDAVHTDLKLDGEETPVETNEDAQLVAEPEGTTQDIPTMIGSDLWSSEKTEDDGSYRDQPELDEFTALMFKADDAGPLTVTVVWPRDQSTLLVIPLYVLGAILLVLGAIIYVMGLGGTRKSRRSKRRPAATPKRSRGGRDASAGSGSGGPGKAESRAVAPRVRGRLGGRLIAIVAMVAGATVVVTGCSTPQPTPEESASVSASVAAVEEAEEAKPPVSQEQMQIILDRISKAVSAADESKDVDDLDDRLTGSALEIREANYRIRKKSKKYSSQSAILAGPIQLFLAPKSHDWPRTLFVVVNDEGDEDLPVAMTMTQQSPRDNYQVSHTIQLMSGVDFPDLPGVEAGTVVIEPDSEFVSMKPKSVASQYIKALNANEKAEAKFDLSNDSYAEAVAKHRKELKKSLGNKGTVTYDTTAPEKDVPALSTADSGALVATYILDAEELKPKQSGGSISVTGAVEALLGKGTTTKGVRAEYGVMLLFYVPPMTEDNPKTYLLGASQELVSVEELGS